MELTLKRLLEQAEFNQVRRGGYDRDEVNTLLDRAVAMATKVEAKLTETLEAARSGTGPSETDIEAEIERRVSTALAKARPERTGPSQEEQADEVARALLLAQRSADAAVQEAHEEAAGIRSQAEADAASIRSDAATELEAERVRAKDRIREEVAELEGIRESLRTDVGLLERHVEEQRNQLRSTIGQLQRLLDDPAGFKLAPVPEPTEASLPEDDTAPLIEQADLDPPAAPAPEPTVPVSDPAATDTGTSSGADRSTRSETEASAALDFGEVEHAPPGRDTPEDSGATEAVPAVADNDDLFMAELRKAIEDEEPLGPRDPEPVEDDGDPFAPERRGWRFGRR